MPSGRSHLGLESPQTPTKSNFPGDPQDDQPNERLSSPTRDEAAPDSLPENTFSPPETVSSDITDDSCGGSQLGSERPQTPTKFNCHVDLQDDQTNETLSSPTPAPDTPPEIVFSPPESVGSNITDDYGWDTPPPGGSRLGWESPQTPTKFNRHVDLQDEQPNELLSSPARDEAAPSTPPKLIFSPAETVSSDITDDYGPETPPSGGSLLGSESPQTPTKSNFPVDLQDQQPNEFLSSPTRDEAAPDTLPKIIFSPPETASSDIADDYGLGTPIKARTGSTPSDGGPFECNHPFAPSRENGTQSLDKFKVDTDEAAPDTPPEITFSPPETDSSDITDDYGPETPVRARTGPTPSDGGPFECDHPFTPSQKNETESLDKLKVDTPSQFQALRKSRSAENLLPRLNTSDLNPGHHGIDSFSKRKQEQAPSPIRLGDVNDRGIYLLEAFMEAERKKVQTGTENTKRLHMENVSPSPSEYYVPKDKIHVNFTNMKRPYTTKPRSKSDVTDLRPSLLSQVDMPISTEQPTPDPEKVVAGPPVTLTIASGGLSLSKDGVKTDHSPSMSLKSSREQDECQKSLVKILPLEICQHLEADSKRCPSWKPNHERCGSKRATDMEKFHAAFEKLTETKPNGVLECIENIVNIAICYQHRKVDTKELPRWKDVFGRIPPTWCPLEGSHCQDDNLVALVKWIQMLKDDKAVEPPAKLSDPQIMLGQTKLRKVSRLSQDFQVYTTKANRGKSVDQVLSKVLTRPLAEREKKEIGFIYIYWQPPNFGHLKIGMSKQVGARMKQWECQCKKETGKYFPSESDNVQPVKHVFRVEALIHAELNDYRRFEKGCPGCGKNHAEWFEVSQNIAIPIVNKWMNWMRTDPYVERVNGKGEVEFVLGSEEQIGRLEDLCKPDPELLKLRDMKPVIVRPRRRSARFPVGPRDYEGVGEV